MQARHPELDAIIERLAAKGVRASIDYVREDHLKMIGLRIRDDFFPLWELTARMNRGDVERLDFEAVKQRRRSGWSPFGPADVHVLLER
ncbi:MAG TPA: hypothetical protein VFA28_20005 [Bryobacteraceae bacterium]|jgi:hypothetical protein|nr:hypothetical protein [Bryobacteraceae bacterium]